MKESKYLKQASDPEASSKELERFAKSKTHQLAIAAAQNPNTPRAAWLQLVEDHPTHSFQNPALPLFLVEDPLLSHQLSEKAIASVLQLPNIPEWITSNLETHPEQKVRARFAESKAASQDQLQKLSLDHWMGTKFSVASNPNAPREALAHLSQDKDALLRSRVAANPNTPTEILESLSNDKEFIVRASVAAHPKTCVGTLERFSLDKSPALRKEVAGNPSTPQTILDRLGRDPSATVRGALKRRKKV